jgi:hypothetical protein
MSMPGFTADVTLYRASENYRGAVAREGAGSGNVVIPQATNCHHLFVATVNLCVAYGWGSGQCRGAEFILSRFC